MCGQPAVLAALVLSMLDGSARPCAAGSRPSPDTRATQIAPKPALAAIPRGSGALVARYYDPGTGRFIQRDPVWDPVSMGNPYTAFGNNPVTGRDPSGEIAWFAPIAAWKAFTALAAWGAGVYAAREAYVQSQTATDYDYGAIGRAGAGGAVVGLASGVPGGSYLGLAGAGLVTQAGDDLARGQVSSLGQYAFAAALGPLAKAGIGGAVRAAPYIRGVAQDARAAIVRTGPISVPNAPGMMWSPRGVPIGQLLSNYRDARAIRSLVSRTEDTLRRVYNETLQASRGMPASLLGRVVGERAVPDILAAARRLGLNATAEARLALPRGIRRIRGDPTTAAYRIGDIVLPDQRLVLELTLESSQEMTRLSLHKQGQLADYFMGGFEPIVITPW